MVFLILALIWAAALLPPLIRARLEANPVNSVGKFRRHLRVLESTTPVALDAEGRPQAAMPALWAREARRLRVRRRRTQIVRALLAAMATTLVVGLIPNLHLVLILHVAFDLAFAAYVYSLVQVRRARSAAPSTPVTEVDEHYDVLTHHSAL